MASTTRSEPSPGSTPSATSRLESGHEGLSTTLLAEVPGEWYVLHTLPRQEKTVHRYATSRGLGSFLPTLRSVKMHHRTRSVVDEPLFTSYVFFKGDRESVFEIDRTRRLVEILDVPDQQGLAWELTQIDTALRSEAPLKVHRFLEVGQRVEVKSGPFKGVQGLIESWSRRDRLVLQIQYLGRAMSFEIDGSLLAAVD